MAAASPSVPGRLDLLTRLPPAECRARIEAAIDRPTASGHGEVIGRFWGEQLRARKRIGYRNSFQSQLRARLLPHGDGTRIECRLGMSGIVVAFMVIWLGIVGSVALAFVLSFGGELLEAGMQAPKATWRQC